MAARVFVVQEPIYRDPRTGDLKPKFDLSPAGEFGEVCKLLPSSVKPFSTRPLIKELREKLSEYEDGDYLMCIGNPVLIGLATTIAADANNGKVNFLQWNGRQGRYLAISASFWD